MTKGQTREYWVQRGISDLCYGGFLVFSGLLLAVSAVCVNGRHPQMAEGLAWVAVLALAGTVSLVLDSTYALYKHRRVGRKKP